MDIKLAKAYDRQYFHPNIFITAALLFLAALALRSPSLTLNSFWHDELFTVSFILASIKDKLRLLIFDFHPPFFNLMVYIWSLIWGKSEFALRMFSAAAGSISVPVSFLIFRKCFDTFTAFTVAILILFLPSHIYYSQELRSYSIGFLLAVIATGYLFLYLDNGSRKNRWSLAVTCALLFAIHYVSIFYIITIYLLAVIGFDHGWGAMRKRAWDLGLPTFALMLPNIPHFLVRRLATTSYWPKPVTFDKVLDTLLFLFKGDKILSAIFLISILIALRYAFFYRGEILSSQIKTLVFLSVFPLSGVISVSLLSPNVTILIKRVIVIFSPAIIVLAATGMSCLPNRTLRLCLLLLYIVFSVWWLYNSSYYTVPTKSDFRGVSKEISRIERENSKILLISLDNNDMKRHRYYFDMFGVKSKILTISKDMTGSEILGYIRNAVIRDKLSKIVLFSTHLLIHKDVIQICDKHFTKNYERIFTGFKPKDTFLMVYSVSK